MKRLTQFLPTGCGGGRTAWMVPDELAHVDFRRCCDCHDFAYFIGGWRGLFWARPRADVLLGVCIVRAYTRAARHCWRSGWPEYRVRAIALVVLGLMLGVLYTSVVLAVGWVVWPWRRVTHFAAEGAENRHSPRGRASPSGETWHTGCNSTGHGRGENQPPE